MGYQLQQAKNYKEAVHYFQKACNAEPYNSSARFCLGVAFDKVKDYFKSLAAFSKCVDIEEEKVSSRMVEEELAQANNNLTSSDRRRSRGPKPSSLSRISWRKRRPRRQKWGRWGIRS